jgi:uncharacterized protein
MSGAIAIFVKTPGYSPVKTRLAAVLGERYAREWHLRAARAVAEVAAAAAADSGATVYWAVAESAAIADGSWSGLPAIDQGEGGLGARMACVHAALVRRHGCGILLGADAPQVQQALRWLDNAQPRQVLGPARDGGFWTYGGNRIADDARWNAVTYSSADTATQFVAAFDDLGSWLRLPGMTDVDRAEDLATLADALRALPAPLAAQRELRNWLLAPSVPFVAARTQS